ncbi:hypothetical protein H2201_002403 [Coniosporium apollinis]|uniref:Uncharacterized protein n=1 Tax=Coniosporium apollinis TaxID=61459 RepID=A0ABQ9P1W1_9PEZI|nr:hypothetical protein H2201_002403 [Coniosporium apollinis]
MTMSEHEGNSMFEGCYGGTADVLFIDPTGGEFFCSGMPVKPDNTDQMSTCPILKNQMYSGEWILIIYGNNGPLGSYEDPFAYQRNLYLNCGPQQTSTVTPTVIYTITSTPTETITTTSTVFETETFDPTTTYTIPSKTARRTYTIRPKPVIEWITKTSSRRKTTHTKSQSIITKTKMASCTVPPRPQKPDPTCTITPKRVTPAALATSTGSPHRRADMPIDVNVARRRIQEARRRAWMVQNLEERAADEPVITVTAQEPVNSTMTETAAPVTTTELSYSTSKVAT